MMFKQHLGRTPVPPGEKHIIDYPPQKIFFSFSFYSFLRNKLEIPFLKTIFFSLLRLTYMAGSARWKKLAWQVPMILPSRVCRHNFFVHLDTSTSSLSWLKYVHQLLKYITEVWKESRNPIRSGWGEKPTVRYRFPPKIWLVQTVLHLTITAVSPS